MNVQPAITKISNKSVTPQNYSPSSQEPIRSGKTSFLFSLESCTDTGFRYRLVKPWYRVQIHLRQGNPRSPIQGWTTWKFWEQKQEFCSIKCKLTFLRNLGTWGRTRDKEQRPLLKQESLSGKHLTKTQTKAAAKRKQIINWHKIEP